MEMVKFGQYLVDREGNITDNSDPAKPQIITADRLTENDWMIFYRAEPETDWHNLMQAFFEACERAEIEETKLKIYIK